MKAKLRLCFVGPAENITLRRWVRWFADQGHDATIVTVEPAADGETAGFRQIDVSLPGAVRKLSRLISAVRLLKEIRKLKPDVVHIHYLRGLAWGLGLRSFHPTVVTPWGSDVLEEQGAFREWYSKRLTRAVVRMADLVAVHSDFLESQIRLLGPKPEFHRSHRLGRRFDSVSSGAWRRGSPPEVAYRPGYAGNVQSASGATFLQSSSRRSSA